MESRRSLDYPGNTVNPPQPSEADLLERKKYTGEVVFPGPFEPKVCARSRCVWCSNANDGYVIICRFCFACQFCGLVGGDIEGCPYCGNQAPDEIKHPFKRSRVIKLPNGQQKRVERGPQRRTERDNGPDRPGRRVGPEKHNRRRSGFM